MADPQPSEKPDEFTVVAERIATGKDAIRVPADLLEEKPPAAAKDESRQKALWAQIRDMNMAERMKLALKGNKEARLILIRDTNRQIQRLVLQNPRISEEEVLMVAKDRNTDDEILSHLADSRDWTKIYALRLALVENARTPVAKALRLLATLGERELSRLAKSKAVPNIIAVQARRIVFQTRERR